MPPLLESARTLYSRFASYANYLQSPVLLIMRLYWGWSFCQTGWGKLNNLSQTTEFFTSINIPLPGLNAMMAGTVECVGGLFLLLGLFSRLTCIPLAFTMVVAYLTADHEALAAIFSDTDKFTEAAPFLFLLTSVIVLAFGPGVASLDYLLGTLFRKPAK